MPTTVSILLDGQEVRTSVRVGSLSIHDGLNDVPNTASLTVEPVPVVVGYADAVLALSPVGYWRLGEASGTVAADASGGGHPGTYVNTPTLGVAGPIGDGNTAVTFAAASSEYVTMGDVAAFEFAGAFSVAFWAKYTATQALAAIVSKIDAGTFAGWSVFEYSGTGRLQFYAATAGGAVELWNLSTSTAYNDGAWHHVVCVWDGTTNASGVKIYVDGVLVAQMTAAAGTPGGSSGPCAIASHGDFTAWFDGTVDDVALFGAALTPTQIAALYALRTVVPVTALTPSVAQSLRVDVDSHLLFNGAIQTTAVSYEGLPAQVAYPCSASDDLARLNRRRPFGTWTSVSATTIATDLIAAFAPGFTTAGVEAGLPAISINLDGSEGFSGALSQMAKLIGGAFYVEDLDLHLFVTEASDPPDDIDSTPGRFLNDPPITLSTDLSQMRTRVYGKGHSEATLGPVAAGATTIPILNAAAWFNAGGGQAISDTQVLTYTGVGQGFTPEPGNWHAQTGAGTTRWWTGVVWAEALGLFVAVAGNGSASLDVSTSPDGFIWTTRVPAAGATWEAVTWSPSLHLLVAVGLGVVMTSPDAITWTTRTPATTSNWNDVVWASGLNLFVAVAPTLGTGTHQVMTSPDGITWTARTAASVLQWIAVTYAPSLNLLAAVAQTGTTTAVMTSPDGITWTTRTTPSSGYNIAWSPTVGFVVTSNPNTFTSPDGITWTNHVAVLPSATWRGLIWTDAGYFVALSDGSTSDIAISFDGIAWTLYTAPVHASSSGRWALAWAPSLGRLVAVGFTGALVPLLMTNAAIAYDTLMGVTGVVVPLVVGAPIHIWVQRDDLAAQADMALIDGGDGLYEYTFSDERRGEASLIALADAYLALFSRPIQTVTYACRDLKTKSGKTVHIDLASPPIGPIDLMIQDVQITEIDVAANLNPRFTVTASTVRWTLDGLLRTLLDQVA